MLGQDAAQVKLLPSVQYKSGGTTAACSPSPHSTAHNLSLPQAGQSISQSVTKHPNPPQACTCILSCTPVHGRHTHCPHTTPNTQLRRVRGLIGRTCAHHTDIHRPPSNTVTLHASLCTALCTHRPIKPPPPQHQQLVATASTGTTRTLILHPPTNTHPVTRPPAQPTSQVCAPPTQQQPTRPHTHTPGKASVYRCYVPPLTPASQGWSCGASAQQRQPPQPVQQPCASGPTQPHPP